jgi:hypothetical protein
MPVCTYYNDTELDSYLTEFYHNEKKDIVDLLKEVRKIDPDLYIIRHVKFIKKLFRKPKEEITYEIIHKLCGNEVQIINLWIGEGLCFNYNLLTICSYLWGFINGYNSKLKEII